MMASLAPARILAPLLVHLLERTVGGSVFLLARGPGSLRQGWHGATPRRNPYESIRDIASCGVWPKEPRVVCG